VSPSTQLSICKGKVVPVLFLNLARRYEGVLGKWKYSSTHSLTAQDGGEWSASPHNLVCYSNVTWQQ